MFFNSKNTLHQIYDYVINSGGPKLRYGLTFPYFIELLDHVAQNCLYSTKNVHGPYSRVRTMFHVMNSSRGRIKLAKDSSETIINPLTGLDSTEPTSFHKQQPQQQSQSQLQLQQTKSSPQQLLRASSLTPQSNSSLKKNGKLNSNQNPMSTPRRSSSIGFTTPSPNQFNSNININSNSSHNNHNHRASISGLTYTPPSNTTSSTPSSISTSHSKRSTNKINSKK